MFYKKFRIIICYISIVLFALCHAWFFNISLIENNNAAFFIKAILIAGYTTFFIGKFEYLIQSNIDIKKLMIIFSCVAAIFLLAITIENSVSNICIINDENYIGIKDSLLINKSTIFYIACLLIDVFMIIINNILQKEFTKKNITLCAIFIFFNINIMILIFKKYSYYVIALLLIELISLFVSLYTKKRNIKRKSGTSNSLTYILIPLCLVIATVAILNGNLKGLYIINIFAFIYSGVKITGNKYSEYKSLQQIYNFSFMYLCISIFNVLNNVKNPIFNNLTCIVSMLTLLIICQIQNIKIIRIKSMSNILYKNMENVINEYAGKTIKEVEYQYDNLMNSFEIENNDNIDTLLCYFAGNFKKDEQQYEMFITYDLKDTKFLLLKKLSEKSYTVMDDEKLITSAINIFNENLQYALVKSQIWESEEDIIIIASLI